MVLRVIFFGDGSHTVASAEPPRYVATFWSSELALTAVVPDDEEGSVAVDVEMSTTGGAAADDDDDPPREEILLLVVAVAAFLSTMGVAGT